MSIFYMSITILYLRSISSVSSVSSVLATQNSNFKLNFNCHIGFTVSRSTPSVCSEAFAFASASAEAVLESESCVRRTNYPNLLTQMLQTQLNVMIKQSPQPQLFLLLPGPVQSPSPARPTTCHNHIGFRVSRLPGME